MTLGTPSRAIISQTQFVNNVWHWRSNWFVFEQFCAQLQEFDDRGKYRKLLKHLWAFLYWMLKYMTNSPPMYRSYPFPNFQSPDMWYSISCTLKSFPFSSFHRLTGGIGKVIQHLLDISLLDAKILNKYVACPNVDQVVNASVGSSCLCCRGRQIA